MFGALDIWREGLREGGVDLSESSAPVDLVVTTAERFDEAATLQAAALLVVGAIRRSRLEGVGLNVVERFMPLPRPERPELLLPLDRPGPARYALRELAAPALRWKRARNSVLTGLIARRAFPPLRRLQTLALPERRQPFLLAAAGLHGLPDQADWLLEPGSGDELSRGVFHVFQADAARPSWVLKYARVRNYLEPFERDERGLGLAARSGRSVAAHAPALLGRLEVDGFHASIETAAAGRRLIAVLNSDAPPSDRAQTIEKVADWLSVVASETAGAPAELEDERRRLAEEVIPHWRSLGAPPDLITRLPEIRPVLTHNDLGSWNIVVDRDDFIVLDWETARARSFPLWDLWYFLADALAQLDGASSLVEKEAHFTAVFAGELPSSQTLFRWTRAAVEASSVPPEAVGQLAMLCWLHHGRSHLDRTASMQEHFESRSAPVFLVERAPHLWMSHPALGASWDRWRL